MKRIGIAASKIAQGNLAWYNICVVVIAFLFSLFIFALAGFSVFLVLLLIGYVSQAWGLEEFAKGKSSVFTVCMVSLAILVAIFNLLAISQNIKLSKGKD